MQSWKRKEWDRGKCDWANDRNELDEILVDGAVPGRIFRVVTPHGLSPAFGIGSKFSTRLNHGLPDIRAERYQSAKLDEASICCGEVP
jgi:hypothetical protein